MDDPAVSPSAAAPNGRLISLTRDARGRLVAAIEGRPEPLVDVRPARSFPWSLPDRYISILDKDGKECSFIRDLADLPPETRILIEEDLRDKVLRPRVRRVVSHRRDFGMTVITAETDRGQVTFEIRSRDDVRVLPPDRIVFRDADGNTYDVPGLASLDGSSRRVLEEYL